MKLIFIVYNELSKILMLLQVCISRDQLAVATFVCVECNDKLCQLCRDRHLNQATFKHHTVKLIHKCALCAKHGGKSKQYFCTVCRDLLCSVCTLNFLHVDHNIVSIDEFLKPKIAEAEGRLIEVTTQLKILSENVDALRHLTLRLQQMYYDVSKEVTETSITNLLKQKLLIVLGEHKSAAIRNISIEENRVQRRRRKLDVIHSKLTSFINAQNQESVVHLFSRMKAIAHSLSKTKSRLCKIMEIRFVPLVLNDGTVSGHLEQCAVIDPFAWSRNSIPRTNLPVVTLATKAENGTEDERTGDFMKRLLPFDEKLKKSNEKLYDAAEENPILFLACDDKKNQSAAETEA